ncbi:ribokinase [Rhodococcus sp. NPDC058521]|uniref:ribokinase n=1 Tax=Rhodococcus sp. NPDC058521 TaxID=3346536 RepID=UPI003666A388
MPEAPGPLSKSPRVVVVGSINMDLTTTTTRLPIPGETVLGDSFATRPGGKGANQAVAAAHAGATVDFVGSVGSDAFASELRTSLIDAEVGISGLREVDGPSGVAAIAVAEDGQNNIIVVAGANSTLSELSDADRSAIATADILVCQLEIPIAVVTAAAQHARTADTVVVLNPSPVRELPDALLDCVDVLVVNENEAYALRSSIDRVPHVVTTRGRDGAVHRGPDGAVLRVPSPSVAAVDTTGAGDAFTGALTVRWSEGPRPALEFACTAGALATTKPGAGSSAPYESEIRSALN